MFLHSGASLHGHEYSNRPPPASAQHLNRRSPLLRSPFAPPLIRNSTTPEPTRQVAHFPPPTRVATAPLQSCMQSQWPTPRLRRGTPEPVVRFQEPEVMDDKPKLEPTASAVVSEEEGSCSASEASDAGVASRPSVNPRRRRRIPRKSNTFFFAQPPPRIIKKRLMKQIRPKLLLQLHQLSVDKRPTPILDVFPASTLAGAVGNGGGRFAKRFPRIFGVLSEGSELGSQDVVLFKSEEYNTDSGDDGSSNDDNDEDNLNRRVLVAVLSPLRREDLTEIVLDDGSVWVAEPLPNGSYEFTHTDAQGTVTTARWVRRSTAKGSLHSPISPAREIVGEDNSPSAGSSPTVASPASEDYRYTFSIIDPLSRRHPIMATLSPATLDVLENYTTVSSSYGRYPPSRPFGHVGDSSDDDDDVGGGGAPLRPAASTRPERRSYPVDVATRNLISITAVWVTLRLGGVMSGEKDGGSARSNSLRAPRPARTGSMAQQQRGGGGAPLGVVGGVPRRSSTNASGVGYNNNNNNNSIGSSGNRNKRDSSPAKPPSATQPGGSSTTPLPRRATSTGAAFMQRRMQMSDASDSERPSLVGGGAGAGARLRNKGRRVLSGDWNVGSWKRSSLVDRGGGGAPLTSPVETTHTSGGSKHQQQQQASQHQAPAVVVAVPRAVDQLRSATPSCSSVGSQLGSGHVQQQQQQQNQNQNQLEQERKLSATPAPERKAQWHLRSERRVQSACYAVSPLVGLEKGSEFVNNTLDSPPASPTTVLRVPSGAFAPAAAAPAGDYGGEVTDGEGVNGRPERRWRRLGHWIRRLGR